MERILHIVPDMRSGGLETLIMNMYREMDRSIIQFDFLVHYTQTAFYDEEIEQLGGRIYRLSFREDNNFPKYLRDLDDFFSHHGEYHIAHGHMASLAVFYLHYAQKYGVHTRIIHSHNTNTENTAKGMLKKLLLQFSDFYATDRFACSETAGRFLFGGRDFHVINNAITVDRFIYSESVRNAVREKYNVGEKIIIGHVGRFCRQKNHKFLVDIFSCVNKRCSQTELWLIGEGELEKNVRKYVDDKQLTGAVRFLGVQKDVYTFYQGMDIFVLPSLFEGFGIVNLEAQACGLKCVVSDQVPQNINVTNNVRFLSIKSSADEWAEVILDNCFYQRENCRKYIINGGFDIETETLKMQQYYLKNIPHGICQPSTGIKEMYNE